MFETLSERLAAVFKKLRGRGKLSESDVSEAMREVRMALLEADVSLNVVKDFIAEVKSKAVGAEVLESLTPAQAVIRVVRDELLKIAGTAEKLGTASRLPSVYMLVGLQGSGKTTTCAKLALRLKDEGGSPLLAAADVYRPAAVTQLETLGRQIGVPVVSLESRASALQIAETAARQAASSGKSAVILDTAGRLHADDEMMQELKNLKTALSPAEILLVADAMTGQDAVKIAQRFHEALNLTGAILTKMDGDARGGAALSIRAAAGCPLKFIGTGEKLKALEPFHPDRMVSRILGMGDVLTLIEKAQENLDRKKALEFQEKLRKADFNLEDYLEQLQQVKKMGPLQEILEMLPGNLFPGVNIQKQLKELKTDGRELVRIEAMIRSMTREERRSPALLNGSRRKRIAAGSGTSVPDVNQLLKNFEMTKKMMKQFAGFEKKARRI